MSTIRQDTLDLITPTLPKHWRYTPYFDQTNVPRDVTVQLYLQRLEPDPDAPNLMWRITYDLVIAVPPGRNGSDDDALDDAMFEVFADLQAIEKNGQTLLRVNSINRETVVAQGSWLGVQQYRIELYTVQQITRK